MEEHVRRVFLVVVALLPDDCESVYSCAADSVAETERSGGLVQGADAAGIDVTQNVLGSAAKEAHCEERRAWVAG